MNVAKFKLGLRLLLEAMEDVEEDVPEPKQKVRRLRAVPPPSTPTDELAQAEARSILRDKKWIKTR